MKPEVLYTTYDRQRPIYTMLCTRQGRRLTRLLLPFVSFTVAVIILYWKIQPSERPRSQNHIARSAPLHVYTPTPHPPIPVWVIVKVTQDCCLHLATTFPEWTVLQYGDIQTPEPGTRHSRCHYLTSQQMAAGVMDLGQEATAYMYAIKRGAEAIYIHQSPQSTDDIMYPDSLRLHTHTPGLLVTTPTGDFNPLQHWGCNHSDVTAVVHSYRLCTELVPAIQAEAVHSHSQAHGENDLARENKLSDLENINLDLCDKSGTNVAMDEGTYGNFRKDNALYMKSVFWALPLIQTDTDICRNYFIQKMLWLTNKTLLLRAGLVIPIKKIKLQDKMTKCKTSLSTLDCGAESVDFSACVKLILKQLPKDILSSDILESFTKWLHVLSENDYHFPKITGHLDVKCDRENVLYSPVNHNVPYSIKKWRPQPFPPINNVATIREVHEKTCADTNINTGADPNFLAPWMIWEDVLLIVVFNNPHYEVIPYLEVLYHSFFPHVLYCGPGLPDLEKLPQLNKFNLTFVSYGPTPAGHFPGSFSYQCLMKAVQMRYKVHGYLTIADDLLLVPQRIKSLSLEKIWFLPQKEVRIADIKTAKECRLGMCDFGTRWRWWEDYQDATIKAMTDLKSVQGRSIAAHNCHRTLTDLNQGEFHPCGSYADIYYVPKHLAQDFVELASIFLKRYVFLEITIPTILRCLVPDSDMEILQGKQIWDESRDSSWVYFTKRDLVYKSYMHPTKWSYLDKGSSEYTQFFCSAVSYIHDPYGRMNKIQ